MTIGHCLWQQGPSLLHVLKSDFPPRPLAKRPCCPAAALLRRSSGRGVDDNLQPSHPLSLACFKLLMAKRGLLGDDLRSSNLEGLALSSRAGGSRDNAGKCPQSIAAALCSHVQKRQPGSAQGVPSTALCRWRESSTRHAAQPLHACTAHLTPQDALRCSADESNLALCHSSICKGATVQQAGGLLLAAHQPAGCLPEHGLCCWCPPGVCPWAQSLRSAVKAC